MLWTILRAIVRSPDMLRLYLRMRRGVRGYHAVSQGLIAIGSGDVRAARRLADEATRIAPDEPLTLLLTAQASQLSGDREAAERTFHAMAARDDTRLLGLHGLYIEAQRRNDGAAAKLYAEEAADGARAPAWAGLAVFDARCAAGDWIGALERLDRNMKSGLVDRDSYRRLRAVLLTARALEADASDDRDGARALALEAVKFAPTLVPAAALAGRLLGEAGDLRRAARIVEAAWKANPHPDLAEAYAHLQPGASARDRLARVEALAAQDAGQYRRRAGGGARRARRAGIRGRAPRAGAAVDRAEPARRDADGRARGAGARRRRPRPRMDDACGACAARSGLDRGRIVSDRWMPVSPVTGRLDAFQWKDPVAELHADEPVIEHERAPRTVERRRQPAAPAQSQATSRHGNVTELRPLEARTVETPSSAPPPRHRPSADLRAPFRRRRRSFRWSTCPTIPARSRSRNSSPRPNLVVQR